jgi:hypothetical protein
LFSEAPYLTIQDEKLAVKTKKHIIFPEINPPNLQIEETSWIENNVFSDKEFDPEQDIVSFSLHK